VGYHRRPVVGYTGAIRLVDEITNVMLANKQMVSSTLMDDNSKGGRTDVPLDVSQLCGSGGCGSIQSQEMAATVSLDLEYDDKGNGGCSSGGCGLPPDELLADDF
jgi:hypothetical protein